MNNITEKIISVPLIYNIIQKLLGGDYQILINKELRKFDTKSILDLGCGTGSIAQNIKPNVYLGVDVSESYLQYARKNFKNMKGWKFKKSDAAEIKSDDNFSLVIAQNLLHHLSNEKINSLSINLNKNINFDKFIVIDGKPHVPVIKQILEKLDGGDYFRNINTLAEILSNYFIIEKKKVIRPKTAIYEYSFIVLKKKIE